MGVSGGGEARVASRQWTRRKPEATGSLPPPPSAHRAPRPFRVVHASPSRVVPLAHVRPRPATRTFAGQPGSALERVAATLVRHSPPPPPPASLDVPPSALATGATSGGARPSARRAQQARTPSEALPGLEPEDVPPPPPTTPSRPQVRVPPAAVSAAPVPVTTTATSV